MFGTLLESRARRRRRPGGAAVSVAVHMAIIVTVTATTVRGSAVMNSKPDPILIRFDRHIPSPPRVSHTSTTQAVTASPVSIASIVIRHVDAPTTIPVDLPPIDPSVGNGTDSIVIGGGPSGPGLAHGIFDGAEGNNQSEWRGVDLQTRIVTSARPRYPESLRQAAIDGTVLVRFVVDTTGRVDMSSVAVVSSTHDLFTRAVRDALPGFRFKPAESGGQHVRVLAEMPFEFHITR